jgi:uncharacterized RDD family membrane protein YckC
VPITVLKNNVPWGPFTRAQVQEGLARGDFTLQYLAHAPGLKDWLPLGEVLDYFERGAALPPVPKGPEIPEVPRGGDSAPRQVPAVPARPPALPVREATVGSPMVGTAPVAPPVAAASGVKPDVPPVLPPTGLAGKPELKPARFFTRFFAFVIDVAVLFVPILFLFGLGAVIVGVQGLIEHTDAETMRQEWSRLWTDFLNLLLLVAMAGAWLYAALMECSMWQATVGKHWVGIKVTDGQGERLSFFRATWRHMAKYFSALPFFLGFTAALFNSRGLAWHDRLANTRVVRNFKG